MQEVLSAKMQAFALLRGGEEAIRYSLYHHKDLSAGALLGPYTYFNIAQGGQDPDTTSPSQLTSEDSNMDAAGVLTAPNRMLVTKVCVPVLNSTATAIQVGSVTNGATEGLADDLSRIISRGLFTFRLLNKEYLRLSPLATLGAGLGVWGAVAASTSQATQNVNKILINNGSPSHNEGYRVILPLETQTLFQAQITFPKGGGFTTLTAVRIGVMLHGVLYRPEQ